LNVLVPASLVSTPFLLWLSSMAEKATQPYLYPGDAMVNGSNGNLAYVTIQHRLGLFGFLGGRDIAQNGRPERRTARSKGRR
jgi:carboxylesterase type B